MAVKELNSEQFRGFVNEGYAIVDCYGEFCSACVMLAPIFDTVAAELNGISFGKINLSFNEDVAREFEIDAMPTVLFFRNGELINKVVGCMEKPDLLELVSQLLYR